MGIQIRKCLRRRVQSMLGKMRGKMIQKAAVKPVNYTYEAMERDIFTLKSLYPFIETGTAGKSVLGRNLYYLRLGTGKKKVFYNGSHHALEWITSLLLMKFADRFLWAYNSGASLRGYDTREIWEENSIFIMPMVNPDGVDLVLKGPSPLHPFYSELVKMNNTKLPFSQVWQANIRGVDLNHNYDALWGLAKKLEPRHDVYGPGPTRYSGPYPESEPETRAVVRFTRFHNFRLVIAYHSQGREIYWTFGGHTPPESRNIVRRFAEMSGYKPIEPTGMTSYSGYKDWFIKEYGRPGFTIEVGSGTNPLPLSQFGEIYDENEEILIAAPVISGC